VPFKAYFHNETSGNAPDAGARFGVVAWHLVWAAVLLFSLLCLLFVPASLLGLMALVAMTIPGVCSIALLVRDEDRFRQGLVWLWSVMSLLAVGITGGIDGPLATWVAMPMVAAIVLNRRALISLGAALSFMAALSAAVVSFSQSVHVPDDQEGFLLSLLSVFSTVIGLGVALLPALRARVERAADAEEARARLLKVVTEQPQLIVSFDEVGRMLAAYGEAPPGLDLHQLMQNGLIAAVHATDRPGVTAAIEAAYSHGRAEVGFTPHAAMDHYLHLAIRRAADDKLYGILSDGSLQHAREAALEAARIEAEQLNQGKSQFLASMSHELRTPLNAVIGFSEIMRLKMFGPLDGKYAEYAQLIWESGQHVLDMINDVLDMSKIEAQRYELTLESFDLREPVSQALRLMRGAGHDKGVEIVSQIPHEAVTVSADKRAVKQIALNLLSNAVKFTPRGGEVRLKMERSADGVAMTITDTGIGIAPDDVSRLGRPYEQAGDADHKAMGTGLGLSIVKAMVGLHGGTVRIDSTLGEGTTVTVRLPIMAQAQEDEPQLPFEALPAATGAHPGDPVTRAAAQATEGPFTSDYRKTPEGFTGFGEFVIRPPKS
jgi:cell cycle sensor histidine kinase DivJ